MNKRLFINAFFLIPLCLIIGQSSACPTVTAVIQEPIPKFFGKDMPAGFYGGLSIGYIGNCLWTIPSGAGPYDVAYYSQNYTNDEVICKFSTVGGPYDANLTVSHILFPFITDNTTCTFYVVEANLNIDGVDDDDEEYPGGYVSLNNDDDDGDGVVDYDDDTNPQEDNLVEISLSVSPSLSTGTMTLSLDKESFTGLRVWSSVTKGEGNMIIPNGDPPNVLYYKEWPVQSMPETLYVEGISANGPRFDKLSLSYTREYSPYSHTDDVNFTVVKLEVFTDSSYTNPLVDWPINGDRPRSPKYLFGENDPIYVQVDNLGTDPQIAEPIYDFVKVTSESEGLALVHLKETGLDTQVFRNNSVVNDQLQLLYLDEESCTTAEGHKIKVIDEEVLTFSLEIQPGSDNYVTCKTVMVDRAEVGTEWQDDYDPKCTCTPPLWDLLASNFGYGLFQYIGGEPALVWFKDESFRNADYDSQINHWLADSDSSHADAVDLTSWSGHNHYKFPGLHFFREGANCIGLVRAATNLGDTDADWVIFDTCTYLNASETTLKADLLNSERCPHLFCGFVDTATWNKPFQGYYFAQYLTKKNMTIKEAWFKYCDNQQEGDTTVAVFGADYCMGESLKGPGPIEVKQDPTSLDTWSLIPHTREEE
jgi:hypothetical protein